MTTSSPVRIADFVLSTLFIEVNIPLGVYFIGHSRAWDGSGHQAIARIFSESVFAGWSYAYFGGMPFPNFYPPVFYWAVGLLAQVFALETAFKLLIFLSNGRPGRSSRQTGTYQVWIKEFIETEPRNLSQGLGTRS